MLLDSAGGVDADKAHWTAGGRELLFHGHDARGRGGVFSIPASGGTPRPVALFDDPDLSAVRGGWGLSAGRMYFSAQEQESDVWVMELEGK